MQTREALAVCLMALALSSCNLMGGSSGGSSGSFSANSSSGSGSGSSCSTATVGASNSVATTSSNNTISVYIADPVTTGSYYYSNEPLVSITICSPNHSSSSQCQTISNILLDTGSTGLRLFSGALNSNVSLTQQTVSVNSVTYDLAECATIGGDSSWGTIESADIQLGNLTATDIPVQIINKSYGSVPSSCSSKTLLSDPCTSKYNGVLGLSIFAQDCGTDCDSTNTSTNPGNYYACDTSGCSNTYNCGGSTCALAIATAQQAGNPVSAFSSSSYNNGFSITLPSVASNGATAVSGTLTLGIGSTAGNSPGAGVSVYGAAPITDEYGEDFQTTFNSTTYGADGSTFAYPSTGVNAYEFPNTVSLSTCSGYYCSSTTQSATIASYDGSVTSGSFNFTVTSSTTLFATSNTAFSTLAAPSTGKVIWGLPFFFGKTVYFGIDGAQASFNGVNKTGPYWAY